MKRKYKCHKCDHENTVDISDMITSGLGGMGGSGIIATEMGLRGIMASSNFGGRLSSKVDSFKHNCTNCGEANIIKIT